MLAEPSPHCVVSPDGSLVATLLGSSVVFRSAVQSPQKTTAVTVSLPSGFSGPVIAFVWSPSSRRLLVASQDQVHVLDAANTRYHAVIRNPGAGAGAGAKPSCVRFGAGDAEICVFSGLGLKLAIFDLDNSSATIEVANPKFYQPSSAHRAISFRSGTSHLALLTRVDGRDTVSIHRPRSRRVDLSFSPDTVDAQHVMWTPDGHWLVVTESAAHGHKLLFYTPDGHQFRVWTGPTPVDALLGVDAAALETDLAPGVKLCQSSPDSRVAVSDSSRRTYIFDSVPGTEALQLVHPTAINPHINLQIWQEQLMISPSGQSLHSFVRASQTISPPGRSASSTVSATSAPSAATAHPATSTIQNSGCSAIEFDSSATLVATRLEDADSTVWIWDVRAAELRAVLIFHSRVTMLSWHPSIRELLKVACTGDSHQNVVFVWDPLHDGPRAVEFGRLLPEGTVVGKPQSGWLSLGTDIAGLVVGDSSAYLMVSLPEPGEYPASWASTVKDMGDLGDMEVEDNGWGG